MLLTNNNEYNQQDYQYKRSALIPYAEQLANDTYGQAPPKALTGNKADQKVLTLRWVRAWNKLFHSSMDEAAKYYGLLYDEHK